MDSNAPVQEKALDALIAFLRAADADAGRWWNLFLSSLDFFVVFNLLLLSFCVGMRKKCVMRLWLSVLLGGQRL